MTTPADWIQALLARRQRNPIIERVTGLPYGWALWMRGLPPLPGKDQAQALVEQCLRQPPRRHEVRVLPGSLWQGFRRLWWQNDEPPPPDQRGLRWLAGSTSLLLHVLFALALVLASLIRLVPPSADAAAGERVEVQFLGRGTPQTEGGGTPSPVPAAVQQQVVAASAPRSAAPSEPAPAEDQATAPAPVEAVAAQPLQVTETPAPTTDFVLPPTTPPVVTLVTPQLRTPELEVRARPIELAEPAPVVSALPAPRLDTEIVPREVQVREREVVIAVAPVIAPAPLPVREVQVPVPSLPEVAVREAVIPDRPAPHASDQPPAQPVATAPAASSAASAEVPTTAPAPAASAVPPAPTAGAGPQAQPRDGGWASAARGDDWSAARNGAAAASAAGNQGLFNADGSVRLAGAAVEAASPRRGAPGSDADSWTRDRLAASGTWLKRPPYDHTPTSFDKYWVPSESLLAEWVRKGIKSIEIPIPGTSSKLSCVVSLLQFGGGCGLSNPNMQEQPALARPPPDIPFKKELQEDNGSR